MSTINVCYSKVLLTKLVHQGFLHCNVISSRQFVDTYGEIIECNETRLVQIALMNI